MVPGDVVAERFELERVAGRGGMGVVFRARDRVSGDPVAVKLLHDASPDLAERLAREAGVLAELSHPGIVRHVAHGATATGQAYLAMEWIDGEDLSARLARGKLTVDEGVALVRRAAEALGFAHARGVVHRDVKPSNLFLAGGALDDVRVLDFGIARVRGAARVLTASGIAVGTPGYMAPEQARGEPDVDARADVYALGCVLFECLAGAPAFRGEHAVAILAKILFEEVPRLADACPEAPRALGELVARMMTKDRAARPADGAALVAAFDALGEVTTAHGARAAPAPAALTGAEQRIVSVVVTRRDERLVSLAPTLVPSGLTDLHETAHAAAARFGARLERLIDGSIVAVLAGGEARARDVATDQAARAARFALALRASVPEARIALCTGRALVESRIPVGEAIERAAALVRAPAAAGDELPDARGRRPLRIDEVTAGLLDARFDVRGDRRMLRLHGEREVVEAPRTLLGKPTACVGRERELKRLGGIFEQCVDGPEARAVLVKGAAGSGKSRLRHELIDRLRRDGRRFQLWIGQGDPVRVGSPFAAIAPALRRSAGVLEGEPLEARRTKLRARVARSVRGDDLGRVTAFIGELTGVELPDDDSPALRAARRDPILMGDQVRRAWLDLLQAECRDEPLVLVIEDLHWSDLPSVKLVDAALRALRDRPFLVLALARPEVQQAFPNLWDEREVDELRLGALGPAAAEQLVVEALGDAAPPATRARIVERAAGNAFFLEELVRAVARGEGDALPDTVLAMTEARLAALAPGARRVLRAASVFGEVFWRGGVRALLGDAAPPSEVAAQLAELGDRELVARRGEGRFVGEDELAFRHALLRECAYGTLTAADRALGHALAGAWLEAAGERDAGVLASHFERGGDGARAAVWYGRAAREALEANDFDGAIAHAGRGAAAGAEGELAGELALLRGEALHWSGRTAEAEGWAREAIGLLPGDGARWWAAAGLLVTILGQRGSTAALEPFAAELAAREADDDARPVQVIALARAAVVLLFAGSYDLAAPLLDRMEALAAAVVAPDPQMRARAGQARGVRAVYAGDLGAAADLHRAVVAACDEAGDARLGCAQRANLGDILRQLGLHAEAERVLRLCLADAERMGLHGLAGAVQQNLGLVLAAVGLLADAAALEQASMDRCRAGDQPRSEAIARAYLAWVLGKAGELDAAEAHAAAAAEALAVAPPLRAHALAIGAGIALARGRTDEALARAREAMGVLESLGGLEEGEALVRLVHAEALHASGDLPGACRAVLAARAQVLTRAAKLVDPLVRASFLGAVAENARTLALAAAWVPEEDALVPTVRAP
jgi:tetratricopeptide (TPR) repeat protein